MQKKNNTRKTATVSYRSEAAQLVVDLIEGRKGILPMFLRMALSDALYEAALLKKIRIFEDKPRDMETLADYDVQAIAKLFEKSAGLFRVLHPSDDSQTFRHLGLEPQRSHYNEPKTRKPREKSPLKALREQLEALEFVPENESCRLQLESQIYRLEQEGTRDEWPDVIGGDE